MIEVTAFAQGSFSDAPAGRLFSFLAHTRNGRLVLTFLVFVTFQFLFAAVYSWLYGRKRDHFLFNADALRNQMLTVREALETSLHKIQITIDAFRELMAELSRGAVPTKIKYGVGMTVPSGKKFSMTLMSGPRGAAGSRLEVFDSDGTLLFAEQPGPPGFFRSYLDSALWYDTAKDWKEVLPYTVERLYKRQKSQSSRLNTLRSGIPDVWSYWDFFYFSTILQTTVGLGDILPNSTFVRMVVSIQLVITYILLIVVLNIVLGT